MATHSRRPPAYLRQLMALRPTTPQQLHRFATLALGLRVGRSSVSGMGAAPFDYLCDAYFMRGRDPVVWASRGGGKTLLGATATLLDLVFKPGIEVRILAGSLQQAERMYEHLRLLMDRPIFRDGRHLLATAPTQRRIVLLNGSRAEVLAGSPRAVRGTRVQVLRCDEVEEMDPAVWSAAQLTTKTATCGPVVVPGRIEALSTHHRPGGLMDQLTRQAAPGSKTTRPRTLYRWNALDVVARCPPELACEGCVLWDDCRGRAKQAEGYFDVHELIRQRQRVSDEAWQAEMMCKRPSTADRVYPRFAREAHVTTLADDPANRFDTPVGGMDLGIRALTVILVALTDGLGEDAHLHIVGEHAARDLTIDQNMSEVSAKAADHGWPTPQSLRFLAVDPAADQRSGQTGRADATVLRAMGCTVILPRAPLSRGIEQVRRRLDRDRLTIDPSCSTLIEALESYRFDTTRPDQQTPMKHGPDGPDHACDALRYLVLALDAGGQAVKMRSY
ncbi:MAG: hypothetical protein AAGH88_06155 [Planctomycetota bacterium]